MNYDWGKIGIRIREERKEAKLSQSDLCAKLYLNQKSRGTVGKWEKGLLRPSLENMVLMCGIFNCELGYLLCEHDCKTREATDVQAATGLSKDSVKKILSIKDDTSFTLNQILEHHDFIELLRAIHLHVFNAEHGYSIAIDDEVSLAKAFGCNTMELRKYLESSSASAIGSLMMRIINDVEPYWKKINKKAKSRGARKTSGKPKNILNI